MQVGHERPKLGNEVFNDILATALMNGAQSMRSKPHAAPARVKFTKSEVEIFSQEFSAEVKPNIPRTGVLVERALVSLTHSLHGRIWRLFLTTAIFWAQIDFSTSL